VLNSFQYLETGILLAVTPRINSGGLVTLEVNQEVSERDFDRHARQSQPATSRRATRRRAWCRLVASRIVLGGLIRESRRRNPTACRSSPKIPNHRRASARRISIASAPS
jgi:general secretion pathway protein D